MASSAIPNIDPSIRYVGVSKLRNLNAGNLKEQQGETLVIQENDTPLAVLLSYKKFLEIKEQFDSAMSMVEMLSNEQERSSLLSSFEDLCAGRVRSLAEIDAELELE